VCEELYFWEMINKRALKTDGYAILEFWGGVRDGARNTGVINMQLEIKPGDRMRPSRETDSVESEGVGSREVSQPRSLRDSL
jgi:hypothetical protein